MHIIHVVFVLALQILLSQLVSSVTLNLPSQLNNATTSHLQPSDFQQSAAVPQSTKPEATSIPFPIAAGLNLTITYLGNTIPPEEVDEYLYYATENVRRFIIDHADDPIRHGRWAYGEVPDLQITVATNPDCTVTYAQLFAVMEGLRKFMLGSSKQETRNLQFDISLEGKGKIGSGLLWSDSSLEVVGDANNGSFPNATSPQLNSSTSPLLNASLVTSDRIPVPIPNTPFTLLFDYFGPPIPPAEFDKSFTASNLRIIDYLGHSTNYPISYDRFEYDDSAAHIAVIGTRGTSITWLQLFRILQGLRGVVIGAPPRYQNLHYEIYSAVDGLIGFGLLWMNDPLPGTQASAATS